MVKTYLSIVTCAMNVGLKWTNVLLYVTIK